MREIQHHSAIDVKFFPSSRSAPVIAPPAEMPLNKGDIMFSIGFPGTEKTNGTSKLVVGTQNAII